MRELSVYFCPQCGRYAYFQLVRNAVCHRCNQKMSLLSMHYLDFIQLSAQSRDDFISREILSTDPSICNRIFAHNRLHNARQIVGALLLENKCLKEENKRLDETVAWMHQTIWDLLAKNKALLAEREPVD